ncbi:hypothetical protein [Stenotrophomonas bentonitica]|uniref:hypothetical protein n=1 Tax=Stenotrophomonas bentonitica TaxID=1450134 RepID=UPI00345E7878
MDPKTLHDLKLIVAVAIFVGTAMQMLAERFGPDYLTSQRDARVPQWIKGLGAWLTLSASAAVAVLELLTPID